MKNIILTGFMGTGKTCVGGVLAQKLGFTYVDLDFCITDYAGMSINDIFAQYGEPHFRDLESGMIEQLCAGSHAVIATGGGAVIREKNRKLLRSAGIVVNLVASAEDIFSRLFTDSSRPLLKDDVSVMKIQTMLKEREPYYAEADIRIDTSGKKVEDVVREILFRLERIRQVEDAEGTA